MERAPVTEIHVKIHWLMKTRTGPECQYAECSMGGKVESSHASKSKTNSMGL